MNGFDAPNTFAALASMCSLTADNEKDSKYNRRLQEMLESSEADEDGCGAGGAEKKRRLSLQQVRALELNFEVENKLEPERKNKLAEDLGLQPRQVAVWFQNRRARCKTKKLERDNALLRATNDKLERQVEALEAELREVKGRKVGVEENSESEQSIVTTETVALPLETEKDAAEQSGGRGNHHHRQLARSDDALGFSCRFESGPSESDPCGLVMKQENNVSAYQQLLMISSSPSPGTGTGTGSCSSSSSSSTIGSNGSDSQLAASATPTPASWFGSQFVRMEEQEQGFYNSEESCNFFSVDQPPTLHWY